MESYLIMDNVDFLKVIEMTELYDYRIFTDWHDHNVLYACKELGLDTETTGLDPFENRLRLIQVYLPVIDEVAILDLWNLDEQKAVWLCHLLQVLADPKVVKYLQNALFDLLWFRVKFGISIRNIVDTQVLSQIDKAGQYEAYLFNAGIQTPNSLEWLSEQYGYKHDKRYQSSDWSRLDLSQDQIGYAGRDPIITYKVGKKLIDSLMVYQPDVVEAELSSLAAFTELNYQCLPVGDVNTLFRLCSRYRQAEIKAKESLSDLMPEDPNQAQKIKDYWKNPVIGKKGQPIQIPKPKPFSVSSPLQVKMYLKQKFGDEAVQRLDTATGEVEESTGKDVLFELYSEHPEAKELQDIIYYRGVAKAASTLESYYNSYDPFRQCLKVQYRSLATQGMGRSSSGNKQRKDIQNAQNFSKMLPSHAHFGLPPVRSFIAPRKGYSLVEIDLAASHLQFARMLSNDVSLQKAKKSGIKVHYFTLSSMLSFEGTKATPEECIDLVKGKYDKSRKDYYEHLYKLAKTVIYSFLNYSGSSRLQQTFFGYELFVGLNNCKQYLDACANQYYMLRQFQDKVYNDAVNSLTDVYVHNRLTGEQVFLGKMGHSITCDGAKIYHRSERYQDRKGKWYYKIKISDVVSVQWMRPEGTVMKGSLGEIHDQCLDLWGLDNARLVNFSHDSVMAEIRTELVPEIASVMCDIITNRMRLYIPDYEPEESWEEQIIKHNWGKYDWQNEPNRIKLAG